MTMSRAISLSTAIAAMLTVSVSPAYSQPPMMTQSVSQKQTDSIRDVRVTADGDEFKALILFDAQPRGAKAEITHEGFSLIVSGVTLDAFSMDPLDKRFVSSVSGVGESRRSRIEFRSVSLVSVGTTLYKRSVLISGKLAAPVSNPSAKPIPTKPPLPARQVSRQTAPEPMTFASAVGITRQSCEGATKAVETDPWDLDHLGEHVLCLVQNYDAEGALTAIEQLEAFAPEDWRVPAAEAELHFQDGETSQGVIAYQTAIMLCENEDIRRNLAMRLEELTS